MGTPEQNNKHVDQISTLNFRQLYLDIYLADNSSTDELHLHLLQRKQHKSQPRFPLQILYHPNPSLQQTNINAYIYLQNENLSIHSQL